MWVSREGRQGCDGVSERSGGPREAGGDALGGVFVPSSLLSPPRQGLSTPGASAVQCGLGPGPT